MEVCNNGYIVVKAVIAMNEGFSGRYVIIHRLWPLLTSLSTLCSAFRLLSSASSSGKTGRSF